MEYNLKIENLSKKFGENIVLSNIDFCCPQHSIVGITGRNGSGKSVLFKCICGLMRPDEGRIFISGDEKKELLTLPNKIGAIIETPSFINRYSGYKNLELLYLIRNKKNKDHIKNIMNLVGLDPNSRKIVKKYSMGMKQRLAIAQAIMEDQEILILDEPMNGLDLQGVNDIRKLLCGLREKGKTILIATHEQEDIELLCDYVYEIKNKILYKLK